MAVYGYVRVSTRQQADGDSLGVQDRMVSGYALMIGVSVDRMFVESGISGSVPLHERPEGKALLGVLRAGDVVIAPKLDRMFRSALDALEILGVLKGIGVSLHLIDLGGDVMSNGISKLVFTILSAVAEAERDRIRERIITSKADGRARGLYLGGNLPFGYRAVDGKLVPDEAQQKVIGKMRDLSAGGASLRRIKQMTGVTISLDAISRICKGEGETVNGE